MALMLFVDDICPKCRRRVKLAAIEPHPDRPDLAIRNLYCIDCGAVKAKTYSLKPGTVPPEISAGE